MNDTIANWNSTVTCEPARVVTAADLDHLIAITTDPLYPGPLRAVGSCHSLNESFTTTGTIIRMDRFQHKGTPANDEITVGAGVTMLELRDLLETAGLQIEVVPEIGNATAGSVACCGTKDASLGPTWPGQISSTVIGVGMVDAHGRVVHVTDPQLLRGIRSSYGLLGTVFEVTFKTLPRRRLRYTYESLDLEPLPTIDAVLGGASGFLGFLMPYRRKLVVERRMLDPMADGKSPVVKLRDRFRRWTRDRAWEHIGAMSKLDIRALPLPNIEIASRLRALAPGRGVWLPGMDSALEGFLTQLESFDAWAGASMIDFEPQEHAFDFAFWAFPMETWSTAIPEYLAFSDDFLHRTGFRSALPTEVYFIRQDDRALLSVCPDTAVFTLDLVDIVPRSPADEGAWRQMNEEFFTRVAAPCGARPLLNQTKFLSGAHMTALRRIWKAELTERWTAFEQLRSAQDPGGRFLTPFFRGLLQPGEGPSPSVGTDRPARQPDGRDSKR